MQTTFQTPPDCAEAYLKLAEKTLCIGSVLPLKFRKMMEENIGEVQEFSRMEPSPDGMERKNPLIVALGDSVTAGHFEFTLPLEVLKGYIENNLPIPEDCKEVIDVQVSYPDFFRRKLIEKYEDTSVSIINSGLAGDTVLGMYRRLDRDVIRYQPDLIIINAVLNWRENCGDVSIYRETLSRIVCRLKQETHADIIMMTANASLPTPFDHPESTVYERACIAREVALEQGICLCDTYKIWEEYVKSGYPLEALLSNGSVHPSATGQEGFAVALMQLFK